MKLMKDTINFFNLFVLIASSGFLQGEVVTIRFQGKVIGINDNDGSLASTAQVGDPATFSLRYDRAAPSNPNLQNTAAAFSTGINLGLALQVMTSGGPRWDLTSANAPEIAVTLENNSLNTTGARDDSFYITPQSLARPVRFSIAGQLIPNVQTLPTLSQLGGATQITARGDTEDGDSVFFSFDRFTFHGAIDGAPFANTIGPLSLALVGSGASRSASFMIPTTTVGAFHRAEFSDDLQVWTPFLLIEGNGFQRNFFASVGMTTRRFYRLVDNAAEFEALVP